MPDYKALYLALFRRTEQALSLLEQAEHEAEDALLRASEPPLHLPNAPQPPEANRFDE
jgi:hypothetical protein